MKCFGKLIPNINEAIAFYDPSTFMLKFNHISRNQFTEVIKNPFLHINHFKTIVHELRHFNDHISTLWGHKVIFKYLVAINARLSLQPEKFYEILDYKNEENRLRYDEYYTEIFSYNYITELSERWKYNITFGRRFKIDGTPDISKPIPFITFSDINEKKLVRVPISIVSLLETNAKYEEQKIHLEYLKQLDEDSKIIELHNLSKNQFLELYNQDLVIYNTAVHLTANLLNIENPIEAFKISSGIAQIALNMPAKLLKSITIHKVEDETLNELFNNMIENNEYGFIFFTLVKNYSNFYNGKFDMEKVLESSNLPNRKKLEVEILEEMTTLKFKASKFPFFNSYFQNMLSFGQESFMKQGITANRWISNLDLIKNSTMMFKDEEFSTLDMNSNLINSLAFNENITNNEWYNFSKWINYKMQEFYEIRGV